MTHQYQHSPVAVVGVGTTTFGRLPEYDATTLGIWALREALEDCGLGTQDIDGLVVQRITDYQKFICVTGITPKFVSVMPAPGHLTGGAIQIAASAVLSGAAKTIALVYGNNGRSAGARYGGSSGAGSKSGNDGDQLWFPYGMTSPGAVNALMFERHHQRYGTTTEQLAEIAVAFRNHAILNPGAVMRKPITVEDHENSRFICEPLRLLDYCLINDGGVALIITTAERAKDLKQPPVYMRGFALQSKMAEGEFTEDFGHACMQSVAKSVYEMADVAREDIDALMVYDSFTPSVLYVLEGFGFCPVGESGRWIQNGRLRLGGELPTNTSGGHLSESYMQGWAVNAEAVRQLRGNCGARQVPGAKLIQYLCGGPISSSIIYGRDAT